MIIPVEVTTQYDIIDIVSIEQKCVFIQTSSTCFYVVKFPCNMIDID